MSVLQLPRLIAKLYETVHELESFEEFKGRPFTPDGHLVGSIGEVVAAYAYEIDLAPCSSPSFDGTLKDGSKRKVEIKLTGGNSFNISEAKDGKYADCLIALKLDYKIGFREIYAGQFPEELIKSRKMNKRGFTTLTVNSLERINPAELPDAGRLSELNSLFPKSNV